MKVPQQQSSLNLHDKCGSISPKSISSHKLYCNDEGGNIIALVAGDGFIISLFIFLPKNDILWEVGLVNSTFFQSDDSVGLMPLQVMLVMFWVNNSLLAYRLVIQISYIDVCGEFSTFVGWLFHRIPRGHNSLLYALLSSFISLVHVVVFSSGVIFDQTHPWIKYKYNPRTHRRRGHLIILWRYLRPKRCCWGWSTIPVPILWRV